MRYENCKLPWSTYPHRQQSEVLHRFDCFQSKNLTNNHLVKPPFLNRRVEKSLHSKKTLKMCPLQGKSIIRR